MSKSVKYSVISLTLLVAFFLNIVSSPACIAQSIYQNSNSSSTQYRKVSPDSYYNNIPTMNGNQLKPYNPNPYFNHNVANPYFRNQYIPNL